MRQGIDFTGRISTFNEVQKNDVNFYSRTLGWKFSIWDFSEVTMGGLPKLKNKITQ